MSRRLHFALFLLIAVASGRGLAQDVVLPAIYRVQLAVHPGDDGATLAKGVAATYGARLDAPVSSDGTVTMSVDGSVLELLARDPRVAGVEPSAEVRTVPHPMPAVRRIQSESTTSWTTGTYAYDASGNIAQIDNDYFTYDVYSRLKSGTVAGQSQEYTYDRYGNLTSIKTGATTIPLTPSPANNNRLASVNGSAVTYDNAGQVRQSGSGHYAYDGNGMMISFGTSTMPSQLYLYTPSDERIASVLMNGSVEVSSAWTLRDASGKVLRRFDKQKVSGQSVWAWRQDYIYNGTQLLASENDTQPTTLHYYPDHLGSPRLITDQGGMKVGAAAYLPFGAPALATGISDLKKFTGHERDSSGLDYMHARYYNWGWGRFLSVDPGKDWNPKQPQSWNMYAYVRNNPMNATDPTGRVLQFTGPRRLQQELAAIVNARMHGTRLVVPTSGPARLVPTNVQGPPSPQQAALATSFRAAINERATVNISLTENSSSVIAGSFNRESIDMADVRALGTGTPLSAAGTIGHEVTEQMWKQAGGLTDFESAHGYALQTSNDVDGMVELPSQTTQAGNTLTMTVPYVGMDCSAATVEVDIVNGDITAVRREQ